VADLALSSCFFPNILNRESCWGTWLAQDLAHSRHLLACCGGGCSGGKGGGEENLKKEITSLIISRQLELSAAVQIFVLPSARPGWLQLALGRIWE
jgi:hypothetical protein